MTKKPGPMEFEFTARLGVLIKNEMWSCVEVPNSVELFATGKAVKVVASVDGESLTAALMPTGSGGHMLSISAKLRKRLNKTIGDPITVRLTERIS